jgi:hypothetical protein
MDSVLSRKLFRDKYTQEIKLQKFNEGGITTLKLAEGGEVAATTSSGSNFTESEKLGYMLAPIAASLLQAKQSPGQSPLASLFGAVGEGVSQIPAIGLKIKELEGKKTGKDRTFYRNMNEQDLIDAKLPPGTVAQKEIVLTAEGAILPTGRYDIKEKSNIQELSKEMVKESRPAFDSSLTLIEKQFGKYYNPTTGEVANIPGIGIGGGMNLTSDEAKDNQGTKQQFQDILFKYRAGSTQTIQETENLKKEIGSGFLKTEKDFLVAMSKFRDIIEKDKSAVFAGYKPEEVDYYIQRGGIAPKKSPFENLGVPKINYAQGAPLFKITKEGLRQ